MHLTKLAPAAALVATAFAAFESDPKVFNYNSTCSSDAPKVRVFNRCDYTVHLWSVLKGQGCPDEDAVTLKPGQFYGEEFRLPFQGAGVSIKIAKEKKCKGVDTTQLEYYIDDSAAYGGNYLDVSFVDCPGEDCPGRNGYYLKSGNQDGMYTANAVNEICPILSCNSVSECAQCSYILPDDRQTKQCNANANLDFYMCGGEAPGEEAPAYTAAPSSSEEESSAPEPTSTKAAYTEAQVAEAAVTPAPIEEPKPSSINVKTEVVYVTEYAYVNAKRHAHGHRHQHFKA